MRRSVVQQKGPIRLISPYSCFATILSIIIAIACKSSALLNPSAFNEQMRKMKPSPEPMPKLPDMPELPIPYWERWRKWLYWIWKLLCWIWDRYGWKKVTVTGFIIVGLIVWGAWNLNELPGVSYVVEYIVEIFNGKPPPPTKPNSQGRFYIFQNGNDGPGISLNWASMPEQAQQNEAIRPIYVNGYDFQGTGDGHNSLKLNFIFKRYPAKDMGITLLSAPDCWGDYECHPTYNLSQYSKLVFWARGERSDEKIRVKAALSSRPYGDSANETIVYPSNGLIRLGADWMRYTIPVNGVDLSRVITPFSITAQARDRDPKDIVIIYLDEIYYE